MRDTENLCANCWKELTQGAACPECGFDNDNANDTMFLQLKTILQGKYVVGKVLSQESDAVTYSGYDAQLDKAVIIREFYPKGMASRLEGSADLHVRQKFIDSAVRYKKSFYKLWTTLEKMQSLSAVVPVYDVFEENATVYAIIEKIDAVPLREYLLRNKDGYIAWENARLMFMPVLTTIEALHSNGIIHGSITPDSLLLCADGKVRLNPFCIQEACIQTSPLEFNATDGYTALEQYDNNHKMCAGTDIYAFSACIYRALVGTNPPPAPAREANDKLMIPNSIAETIPMHVIKALGSGLQIYPEKRIKTIGAFRELLDASPSVRAAAAESASAKQNKPETKEKPITEHAEKKKSKKGNIIIIVLVVLIVAAIGAGVYFSSFYNKTNDTQDNTQSTVGTAEVPQFVNMDYTKSYVEDNASWNSQFKITYEYEYSTDVEEGIIFKQSVAAGESVNVGTEIVLTVSKGIQTEEVIDVGGLNIDEATKKLEEKGFKVSTVEVYNDGSHTPNTVKTSYGMAPAAGEVVAVGEQIVLQVYGEVQTTTTQPQTEDTSENTD